MRFLTAVGPNRPPFCTRTQMFESNNCEPKVQKMVAWGVSANVFCTPGGSNRPRSNPNVRIWTIVNRGCEKRPRGGLNRAFLNRRRSKPPPVLNPNPNVRFEPLRTESVKNDRGDGQCVHFLHPRGFQRPPGFKPKGSNLINCEPSVRKTPARGVKSWVC